MQVFLPYADFAASIECLDKKRCWKQLVEVDTIIEILEGRHSSPYYKHAAVRAWKGYTPSLRKYRNICLEVCLSKHKINTKKVPIESGDGEPPWFGYKPLHASHRGRLLMKDFEFYSRYGWPEQPMESYIYPVDKEYNLLPEIREALCSTTSL